MTAARQNPQPTAVMLGPPQAATGAAPRPAQPARATPPNETGGADLAEEKFQAGERPVANAERPVEPLRYAELDNDVEHELLRRISGGDRDAFQQLYLRYHQRLSRFLLRVTRRPQDVEDVINDALLLVWQRAGQFRGASRVSTWIFGISYRCALKSIRRSTIPAKAAVLQLHGGEQFTADTARELEERQLLDLGLVRLPLEQRLALVLAYCLDYSCEEIAAIVDCPVNTVKTRMFHARRKLRSFLSEAVAG